MMEDIQIGALGPSVPKLVEMGVAVAVGHVPVPLQALVERTAHNWDQRSRTRTAMKEAVQVYS